LGDKERLLAAYDHPPRQPLPSRLWPRRGAAQMDVKLHIDFFAEWVVAQLQRFNGRIWRLLDLRLQPPDIRLDCCRERDGRVALESELVEGAVLTGTVAAHLPPLVFGEPLRTPRPAAVPRAVGQTGGDLSTTGTQESIDHCGVVLQHIVAGVELPVDIE